ncbi:MAG TPA: hypothetical protein VNI36_02005 [Candidatus Dormibacteraeota bacterium]|nr:hypothetical protein [Candidatus Dormibacteraeota bacterium]
MANISAILLLAAVLSLDVNAVSCVLFPAVVTLQSPFQVFLTFCATHAATVLLAGAFGFLSVFAVMGVMMSILPYQLFRKSSLFVRCALLFSLAALLSTAFTVPQKFSVLVRVRRPWTAVPPPAWFLGLCESMRKSGGPVFGSLAAAAVWSLTLVFVLALAAFSLSFRRTYLSSGESTESRPSNGSPASLLFRWLDRVLLKSAFDRGCYRFALRAIFRSQEHAFIFGMFGTVGVVLASQALIPALGTHAPAAGVLPSVQILSIPLILGFFLILGLYTAFSVPAPLRSNWVFRFNVDPQTRLSASLARKIVYTFLVPLLFAPCLIVYSHVWGWEVGLLHTGLVAAWCTLLLEGLLVKFRKIPFTCSAPGFKSHAIITALTFLLGYFVFTSGTAAVENWAFGEPALFAGLLPIVLSISFFFYRQRKGLIDSDRRVTFEDKPAPVVEAMNLVR